MRIAPAALTLCAILAGPMPAALAQDTSDTPATPDTPDLTSEDARIAYAIGMNIGMNLMSQGLLEDLDPALFLAGVSDSMAGDFSLGMDEMIAALEIFQQRQQEAMEQELAESQAAAAETLAMGQAFLDENGERDEVVTLDSGLQYEVLGTGPEGASPAAADAVLAHYHGTLIDGSIFDSSVDRGEPAQFALSQVIPGWTEALQLMRVGDEWRLFIPPDLAYGESSPSPAIPPNSVLIFDVELLEIIAD
ncbi:MAG: FKBP-type peptidyl-prolyl cis-trans isomerase [Gammaproteobacteria bacterium]|nr:FKBP-type peptidyl-prolyl cis-trans isomerase [Gammaproteobacteria bacterium]